MTKAIAGVYLRSPDAPVSVDAAYPANYGLGGARWLVRSFFVEGGFGAASVHTRVNTFAPAVNSHMTYVGLSFGRRP